MSPHADILIALKTITLLLGALITYYSYKAHVRTKARPLWYLAVGFGIVTLGVLIAGIVDQVLRFAIISGQGLPFALGGVGDRAVADAALVIESALTALGFAVIVYSLYTE